MDIDGQLVNLEIQVKKGPFRERSLYYWARNFSTSLKKKGKYNTLPRTISINILEEPIFNCDEYCSEFRLLETTRNELLTDKLLLKYYELRKVPTDFDESSPLECWLTLFGAKTEDELMDIERLGVPEMNDAIKEYRDIVVSDEFKELQRLREKAEHDEAQAIADAVEEALKKAEHDEAQAIADAVEEVKEQEKKKYSSKLKKVLAEKDTVLAEKDATLVEKDALLAEKDALITKLLAEQNK